MKKKLIGVLLLSNLLFAGFIRDDGKGVVFDTTTHLMWQDSQDDVNGSKTWGEAIVYCENLEYASYDDWYLPNINELLTIVDIHQSDPAINSHFVYKESYPPYWSSTASVDDSNYAFSVNFDIGSFGESSKTNQVNVRCVRRVVE
ncbi:hypothetical protein MNB_SM-3-2 [hydrothermal vent metagenome]|uniref:Lcl C-terminal domain-containing protein n=1 Tax=hydrothermal vent metagenome TaxID=652676 RepID=A0A1W1D3U8_9ZZZZ